MKDDTTKKSFKQAMISKEFLPDTLTHVYAQSSTIAAIYEGGSGFCISHTTGTNETLIEATGKLFTKSKAEIEAFMPVLTITEEM